MTVLYKFSKTQCRLARRGFLLGLTSWLAAAAVPVRAADDYPQRPIRMIVGNAAGGVTDVAARILADEMSKTLGQPVVVENKTGASGAIAVDFVAKSAPDGYVITVANIGPMVLLPLLEKPRYDATKDFTVVSPLCLYELMLVSRTGLTGATVPELLAYARANPGKLSFASAGAGTAPHLAFELMKSMANLDMVHVPYKGDAPSMNDLIGNQVDLGMIAVQTALPQVKAGKVRGFATSGKARFPLTPDMPTVAEAGLPGFEAYSWSMVYAPAGTPQPVVDKLNGAINAALKEVALRDRYVSQGITPFGGTPQSGVAFMQAEVQKWGKVVRDARITIGN